MGFWLDSVGILVGFLVGFWWDSGGIPVGFWLDSDVILVGFWWDSGGTLQATVWPGQGYKKTSLREAPHWG